MVFPSLSRALLPLVLLGLLIGCKAEETVVIYTSVDRHFSEPVLQAFEAETGIKVNALYDVEAAKTTGLVNKLIAESGRPRADVFWNGEFLQTAMLADHGLLAAYETGVGQQDPQFLWTTFGGRARVLIINTNVLARAQWPTSLSDFLSDDWQGEKLAMSHPLFGTSATHAAALFATMGNHAAGEFYRMAQARGVLIVDGNSVVRDLAVRGEIAFGLTDTDDACRAVVEGEDVAVVFPDQQAGGLGTLVIPNSVALIAGAPHIDHARTLVDYLLSDGVTNQLTEAGWFHVNGTAVLARECGLPETVVPMQLDPALVLATGVRMKQELRALLVH